MDTNNWKVSPEQLLIAGRGIGKTNLSMKIMINYIGRYNWLKYLKHKHLIKRHKIRRRYATNHI